MFVVHVALVALCVCGVCLFQGEKAFFLMPGEKLQNGIQDIFILGEDDGLILRATEGFTDSDASVSGEGSCKP